MAIRNWKPWTRATGPKTVEGKAVVARNADKGGKRPELRNAALALRKCLRLNQEFLDQF